MTVEISAGDMKWDVPRQTYLEFRRRGWCDYSWETRIQLIDRWEILDIYKTVTEETGALNVKQTQQTTIPSQSWNRRECAPIKPKSVLACHFTHLYCLLRLRICKLRSSPMMDSCVFLYSKDYHILFHSLPGMRWIGPCLLPLCQYNAHIWHIFLQVQPEEDNNKEIDCLSWTNSQDKQSLTLIARPRIEIFFLQMSLKIFWIEFTQSLYKILKWNVQ